MFLQCNQFLLQQPPTLTDNLGSRHCRKMQVSILLVHPLWSNFQRKKTCFWLWGEMYMHIFTSEAYTCLQCGGFPLDIMPKVQETQCINHSYSYFLQISFTFGGTHCVVMFKYSALIKAKTFVGSLPTKTI